MTNRTFLIVFTEDVDVARHIKSFSSSALKQDENFYVFAGNVMFLKTTSSLEDVTNRIKNSIFGMKLFVINEITHSATSGKAPSIFWDFMKDEKAASKTLEIA
jgi:hypothetical protein